MKSKDTLETLQTYKFLLKPTMVQEIFFAKTFGCVRKVYNLMLADRRAAYMDYKNGLIDKIPSFTPARYKQDFPYLKEVDSSALANAQMNLNKAYSSFFNGKGRFPKFKSKKTSKLSYTTNCTKNNIRIDGNFLVLPKLKSPVKVVFHRRMTAYKAIKNCTISKTCSGRYYVSITVSVEPRQVIPKPLNPDRVLGLDYSSSALYVDNQNNVADYPRFYRKNQEKLARLQRQLSRKQLGSNNREKARKKVAKLHELTANQRKDFLHKLSHRLSREYDYIIVEEINLRAMSRSLKLGKSTLDNGFGMLRTFLSYKLLFNGGALVKVGKFFPSSQLCSNCGYRQKLTLKERTYICPDCGTVIDRDHNAAINIKNEGLKILLS